MRGILIDATQRTVSEVTLPDITTSEDGESDSHANWEELKKLLDTTIVEPVRMGAAHLWVDEEGLLKPEPGPFFRIGKPGAFGPIISKKGILLGCQGPEGDPIDFPFILALAEALVDFLPEGTKFVEIETREGETDHPVLGRMATINRVSIFETPDGKRIEQ